MREEMSDILRYEQKRRKRRKIISTVLAWLLILFVLAAIAVSAVSIAMAVGGRSLRSQSTGSRPNLTFEDEEDAEQSTASSEGSVENAQSALENATTTDVTATVWQEGWVRHNGKIYEYNEDVMTFLVLGIDKMTTVKESTSLTDGGQSDAIFLVVANPDTEEISIVGVNRDTMTDIQMYGMGEDGSTIVTYAQLAVQHGFGDGKELSCELTQAAVSALFYDLPIHGYVAVNMGAISKLNDAIGGVEVTVLDDLTKKSKNLQKGATVTLKGEDAFWYVKYRDTKVFESARGRLARQKQYLTAFTKQLMKAVKKDITLPVTLYQELSKYMVTDVTINEVAYLAGQLSGYSFSGEDIYTLEGETKQGERYEEFYPDKAALKDLMITLFYQEVEQAE